MIGIVTPEVRPPAILVAAGWTIMADIARFTDSRYVLCVTSVRRLGAITPFGEVLLTAFWLMLAIGTLRCRQANR